MRNARGGKAHQIGGDGREGNIYAQLSKEIAVPPLFRMAEVQGVQVPGRRNNFGPGRMLPALIPRRGPVVDR